MTQPIDLAKLQHELRTPLTAVKWLLEAATTTDGCDAPEFIADAQAANESAIASVERLLQRLEQADD